MVALFGKVSGNQIEVEWVLPLKPLLMLVPKPERIVQLKDLLIKDKGSTPVIFSLGQGVIQLIDPRLWVDPKPETIDAIASLVDYLHWDRSVAKQGFGCKYGTNKRQIPSRGQMTWNTNL